MAAPCLLVLTLRGRSVFPSLRLILQIFTAGLLLQLAGNLGSQWAMGVVGLAVNIPAFFGVTVIGAAILARVCLAEPIPTRSVAAMLVLLGALILLGIGAEKASQVSNTSEAASVTLTCLVLAVVASGVAGGTSAVLGVALRDALNKRVLPMTITFLVPFSGAITLGPTLLTRFGATTLANTPMEQWWLMFGAGAFNFIGFLSFVTGLQRTTVRLRQRGQRFPGSNRLGRWHASFPRTTECLADPWNLSHNRRHFRV